MRDRARFLLLQARNAEDPMRTQEVRCFAWALRCDTSQIKTVDLLNGTTLQNSIDEVDMVLLGGSGDYSVAEGGAWLPRAQAVMRQLYEMDKPTFASCWGFQAMAQALGGKVVKDTSRAELGIVQLYLTTAGKHDPVFGRLSSPFNVPAGHHDIVDELPDQAVLLASSELVENQAYTFPGKPIYCTQFHPELNRQAFMERLEAYPQYVEEIAGVTKQEFAKGLVDTPEANALLPRFAASLDRQKVQL